MLYCLVTILRLCFFLQSLVSLSQTHPLLYTVPTKTVIKKTAKKEKKNERLMRGQGSIHKRLLRIELPLCSFLFFLLLSLFIFACFIIIFFLFFFFQMQRHQSFFFSHNPSFHPFILDNELKRKEKKKTPKISHTEKQR